MRRVTRALVNILPATRAAVVNGRVSPHGGDGSGDLRSLIIDHRTYAPRAGEIINLRTSEIRYRRLFEAARDGILIVDPLTRKITDANPFMTELLGYPHEELLGKELWEIGLLKDEAANRAAFEELEARHYVRYEDLPLQSKTGQRREVEFVSNVYEEDGQDVIQCNIREITERKTIETKFKREIEKLNAELEQRVVLRTAELKAANAELEAFSYSISHDLRAPLRAMDGFTKILETEFNGNASEVARHAMGRIRVNAATMGQLIEGLLAFSGLGRRALAKTTVAPANLARAVFEELRPKSNGQQVEVDIAELPACEADPTLLKQVFANLLTNALKYSRDRDPAVIKVGWRKDKDETVYFVQDNGAGYEAKFAHKLFQVFQRLHRTDQFEGTGVGLAIVRRIVERHGGRIWAESQVDHGATFFFTLGKHAK